MRGCSGIGAAPVKESDRSARDQFVDTAFSAVIHELVYRPTAEAQDPGLNAPLRDKVNDSLTLLAFI